MSFLSLLFAMEPVVQLTLNVPEWIITEWIITMTIVVLVIVSVTGLIGSLLEIVHMIFERWRERLDREKEEKE